MSNNYYQTLWVEKSSTQEEIKKAYRKLAMKYHPDRNKWDKTAEQRFKEINEAYWILWDEKKRKQYDTFWTSWWNPFSWWSYSSSDFSWFEDIFSWFWWKWRSNTNNTQWFNINIEDLFWWFSWNDTKNYKSSYNTKKEEKVEENLDFEKTYEVPIFDLILWCKIEVKWVYGQSAKLKIPSYTKPWAKFRIKDFWKSEWLKKWNLIIKIDWKMPKNISDIDKQLLERIRENVWY